MDWFLKHPQWLYSESIALSNNSIYKEKFQFADKTFISTGDILVHKDHTEYYPILIVYPEATPYVPPTVYVLENSMNEETTRKYSLLLPKEIKEEIRQNIRFITRRHQNEDGSVCFIETGDLHGESAEIYPIKCIIKRIRTWLSGKIKDSREVELFAHFRDKYRDCQYLLPDLFFDAEVVKGVFFAGLPSIILTNLFMNIWHKTYMGICIVGENEAGLSLPPKIYANEERILFTDLPDNLLEFIKDKKNARVQKCINAEKIIEGYWWDIDQEPDPFIGINTLADYIGKKNRTKGFEELIHSLKDPLNKVGNVIHLGLRFPGRWRDKDWQMFRLERGCRSPIVNLHEQELEKELKERLLDYSVKAVYQEYLTEEYFHMRNKGRAERDILKKSNISIIGCGALGSEISDCLCKAGVGNLTFIDKEVFKTHNAVRHSLGINRANFPKVLGMAEHSWLHNPFVKVNPVSSNVLETALDEYLSKGSIGISSIADDNVESYLNEKAVEQNETVFYCRALRGGKVARVFRVIPTRDACKNCLAIYSKEHNPKFVDIPEDEDLPVITTECNNPIRPASAADLKIIASLTARIIIDYLQGNCTNKNHWIWATEPLGKFDIESSKIGGMYAQYIPPHPDCPICQRLRNKKVSISKEAYELMKHECEGSRGIETGGILIGHITEKGNYIISRATQPGPNAVKTQILFERDEKFCQKELENALKELGSKGIYLGEWHYHPKGSNFPSGIDIKSLTEIAQQKNYHIDKPILIILSSAFEYAITIHDRNSQCVQLPLNVVRNIEEIK